MRLSCRLSLTLVPLHCADLRRCADRVAAPKSSFSSHFFPLLSLSTHQPIAPVAQVHLAVIFPSAPTSVLPTTIASVAQSKAATATTESLSQRPTHDQNELDPSRSPSQNALRPSSWQRCTLCVPRSLDNLPLRRPARCPYRFGPPSPPESAATSPCEFDCASRCQKGFVELTVLVTYHWTAT